MVNRAKEIIRFASKLSKEYYGKPLNVVCTNDDRGKLVMTLIREVLNPKDYQILLADSEVSYLPHYMNIFCKCGNDKPVDDFGVIGIDDCHTLFYSFEHVKDVYKDAQEMQDPVYDCVFIEAMRHKANTFVCPISGLSEDKVKWVNAEIKSL